MYTFHSTFIPPLLSSPNERGLHTLIGDPYCLWFATAPNANTRGAGPKAGLSLPLRPPLADLTTYVVETEAMVGDGYFTLEA